MKTQIRIFRTVTAIIALSLFTLSTFAEGDSPDVYLTGKTAETENSFIVIPSDEIFNFQGKEYEVYKVTYDNPTMNMKIAVLNEDRHHSFVAYTADFTIFYECTREGFGSRKILFANPDAMLSFNPNKYSEQLVLDKSRKVTRKHGIELIAGYVPSMRQ